MLRKQQRRAGDHWPQAEIVGGQHQGKNGSRQHLHQTDLTRHRESQRRYDVEANGGALIERKQAFQAHDRSDSGDHKLEKPLVKQPRFALMGPGKGIARRQCPVL
jgi:hypothetical protein